MVKLVEFSSELEQPFARSDSVMWRACHTGYCKLHLLLLSRMPQKLNVNVHCSYSLCSLLKNDESTLLSSIKKQVHPCIALLAHTVGHIHRR